MNTQDDRTHWESCYLDPAHHACALERIAQLESTKCASPGAASCAREWEADHQRVALERVDRALGSKLAEEFPFGCDTIEYVATTLVAVRHERARLRAALSRLGAQAKRGDGGVQN